MARCGIEGGGGWRTGEVGGGGAAASMAAIANLPSLTSGGLLPGSSSSAAGDKEGEANSWFVSLRGGARSSGVLRANLTASSSSVSSFSTSSSSSSSPSSEISCSRRSIGRISFLPSEHTALFMIHRLACACNGDSKRQQTVCNGLSNGSENAAYQVRMSGFLKSCRPY